MEHALELVGMSKYFESTRVQAVDDLSLDVRRGEVLAVIGENGTGKTTLMNMLFGLVRPDTGTVKVAGRVRDIRSPAQAIAAGIGMVHQHFTLVPSMTAAQNVMLGRERARHGVLTDDAAGEREVAELAARYHLHVPVERAVRDLPVGVQQRVEILKSLARQAQVLILDEPTAVLTPQEALELGATIRELSGRGHSVIFISHKLGEVLKIADRIAVMRRGRLVTVVDRGAADGAELARLMVGRPVVPTSSSAGRSDGAVRLEIDAVATESLRHESALDGVSLEVRAGRILGVAGVSGNGQTELAEVVAGLRRPSAGTVRVDGTDVTGRSPDVVRSAGVAHVPEDRNAMGVNRVGTIEENIAATRYRQRPFSRLGVLSLRGVRRRAAALIDAYDVKGARPQGPIAALSGGNMQKVVIARELDVRPAVLLANQPTRGLDVGSIEFVHRSIVEARDAGTAVLLISAELDEIFALADDVAVMYDGALSAAVPTRDVDAFELGLLMTGGRADRLETRPPTTSQHQTAGEIP